MPTFPVTNIPPNIQYVAGAGQTVFNFSFYLLASSDLLVFKKPLLSAGDDVAYLLPSNQYVVAININNTGGTVTLNVGATLNDIITIVRQMPPERLSFYTNAGPLTPDGLNTDFESEVLMIQQNNFMNLSKSLRYNFSDVVGVNRDLRLPLLRPNQYWAMNNGGTAIEGRDAGLNLDNIQTEGLASAVEGDDGRILFSVKGATKAEVKAGVSEDVAVTPKSLGSHKGMILAQAIFSVSNEIITKKYYYGIEGIEKRGLGQYEIFFSTPFDSDIYGYAGSAAMDNISAPQNKGVVGHIVPKERTSTSFKFWTVSQANMLSDFDEVNLTFSGQMSI